MRFGSILGWGIVIYSVVSLVAGMLSIYELAYTQPVLARSLMLLTLVVVATIAGRSLRFYSWHDLLPYSAGWALVCMLLDAVYVVPFTGAGIYQDPNLWIGYALVFAVPLLSPFTQRHHVESAHVS